MNANVDARERRDSLASHARRLPERRRTRAPFASVAMGSDAFGRTDRKQEYPVNT